MCVIGSYAAAMKPIGVRILRTGRAVCAIAQGRVYEIASVNRGQDRNQKTEGTSKMPVRAV